MAEDERGSQQGAGRGSGRGDITISNVNGSFAIGDRNSIVNQTGVGMQRPDPEQQELLRAVLELRADLQRLLANDQTAALDTELAGTQAEIEASGRAGESRLARLRQALADAGALTGLLASAAAVGQAVGALTGS
ncbi:hypothetical protein ACFS5L_12550 [Streptomyces phyllanthi]|uniref:Uncharacterized protein n=1 Tax=Streptomyces phyllanthi TaxID=1803180 RepID=A0A5N8WK44_9ACTN|nr:hypothetical protein [Streptomyces phyllanthi]MPY46884.1 hypothetical protein [Streptomyces phyllanthi]